MLVNEREAPSLMGLFFAPSTGGGVELCRNRLYRSIAVCFGFIDVFSSASTLVLETSFMTVLLIILLCVFIGVLDSCDL